MKTINLEKNIQLCFNSGFGTLITAKNDEDYRNAVISIHNGLELLMKSYLRSKEECLIYRKITYEKILNKRNDLRKKLKLNQPKTISYPKCIEILKYFSELPEKNSIYLKQLAYIRDSCVHFEYSYDERELRKLLISHIYQFICDLIIEMGLDLKTFIPERNLVSLDKLKNSIDDEIMQNYLTTIESAKKHYFVALTVEDRKQKAETEDYTQGKFDIIVKCPACEENALLRRKIQGIKELLRPDFIIFNRDLILRDLSCFYCGLSITDYDQLELEFKDKEKSLQSYRIYLDPDDYPDDCPEYYDCLEYHDCPSDCPDGDCPDGDCPDGDCPDGDCPDER